nr:MAG TPA: hypothetical protein [Caudoviricetes sp.]
MRYFSLHFRIRQDYFFTLIKGVYLFDLRDSHPLLNITALLLLRLSRHGIVV